MKRTKNLSLFSLLIMTSASGFGQCADTSNIYDFVYNGHSYEVVKENKTWTNASACSVERNGYLAEINDEAEQNAIFNELSNNAGIVIENTQNQFGTASVWLGGSDAGTEGNWIWDGNNDGLGPQFWSGSANGSPVGGLYTNWGTSPAEPDNSGGQDHLTIIIKPSAVNFSLWNDLISTNSLYYLIEKDSLISGLENDLKSNILIFPNPFNNYITIENNNSVEIKSIELFNLFGRRVNTINSNGMLNNEIDVSNLVHGMYSLQVYFEDGITISYKIVK